VNQWKAIHNKAYEINLIQRPWGYVIMRYLVTARVKPGREEDLLRAIEDGTLGAGSVAEGEYLRNMREARLCEQGKIKWVEICFCDIPLQEELPYWQEYFDIVRIQDAHGRQRCRHLNRTEPWACCECDCTERLEKKLATMGQSFLSMLRNSPDSGDRPICAKRS
jgi:hypothetical protein